MHDPHANSDDTHKEYKIALTNNMPDKKESFAGVAILVPHNTYKETAIEMITGLLEEEGVLFDLKGIWRSSDGKIKNYITL